MDGVKPEWVSQIKIIGWDLDGTLYPNHPEVSQQITKLRNKALADKLEIDEMLAEFEFKQIQQRVGSNTEALALCGINGKEFFTQIWDELDLARFIQRDEQLIKLFESLNGYHHFLLSNSNSMKHMQTKLELIGLDIQVFDAVVDTVELDVFKPDPQAYQEAVRLMTEKLEREVTSSEILYVGDRVETDINGAKGVGMRTCLVGSESQVSDLCVSQVYQIKELLEV